MTKQCETAQFLRYGIRKSQAVAVFAWPGTKRGLGTVILNRRSLMKRLTCLKLRKLPHDQTQKAVDGWPERKAGI